MVWKAGGDEPTVNYHLNLQVIPQVLIPSCLQWNSSGNWLSTAYTAQHSEAFTSLRDRKQNLKRVNTGLRWTLPSVFWGDCVFFLAACGGRRRHDLWWHTSNGRRYKQWWSQFLSREEWWGYFVQLWIPFYISSYICMYSIFALSALRSGDSATGVNMRDDGGIRIENYFCDWQPSVVILDSSFVGSVMPLAMLLTL